MLEKFFRRLPLLVCLFLAFVTTAIYLPVRNHEFVDFDDEVYVTENEIVQKGVTWEGVRKILAGPIAGFYHPLTLFSHMLTCQLFGLNPGPHHLVNLVLHVANTVLLFLALRGMTGALWRSAFVAALFALYPLHVESVAWVAERKGLLSTFFWFLTLLAYGRYARQPGITRYLVVLFPFVLGLLAKPMLVTLPLVLLLLDYWPLKRMVLQRGRPWIVALGKRADALDVATTFRSAVPLFMEKIPLLAFSAAASVLAWQAQIQANALVPLESLPFLDRLSNALLSYVAYICKMCWPQGLSVHYPHSGAQALWKVMGATLLLFLVTTAAVRLLREKPYLLVGWLWYLGTLVPVIGLVQVGSQAMADRYTYIPLTGLFLMIVWGLADLMTPYRCGKIILSSFAAAALAILAGVTHAQLNYWKNSVTLFEHTIRVTGDNAKAHNNLGVALAVRGRIKEAEEHYRKALLIAPNSVDARNNLGNALADQGRHEEAGFQFQQALALNPRYAKAHHNLGISLAQQGRVTEAEEAFRRAIRLSPGMAVAYNALATVYAGSGRFQEAVETRRQALSIQPNNGAAQYRMAVESFFSGDHAGAVRHCDRAVELGYDGVERAFLEQLLPWRKAGSP